ncbi:MAG: acyltransferase [Verrucomicrobium sp.]|nr:acyltransferase [Verrucomicrobium sp.]
MQSGHPSKSHLPAIDALRAAASLAVVAVHCVAATGWFYTGGAGPFAVDVFVVISGFLMAFLHDFKKASLPRDVGRFYVRRFFRIVPLYYAALLLCLLLFPFSAADLLLRLSFLFGLSPAHCDSITLLDWSLGLEMQFYLVFPLLFLTAWSGGGFFAMALLTCMANLLIGAYPHLPGKPWGHFNMPSFLPLMLALFGGGMFLARVIKGKAAGKEYVWFYAGGIACLVALPFLHLRLAMGLVLLLAALFRLRPHLSVYAKIENACANRLTRSLADWSYALYLIHPVTLRLLEKSGLALKGCVGTLELFALVLAVTYPVCHLLFRFLERPGIRLGRRIEARIGA